MRVFPVTNFSQTLLTYAGKSVSFALLSLLFVLAPAREVLFAVGAKTGSPEATSGYPEPPPPMHIWNTTGPLPSYYGGLHASGVGFQYWNNYMLMEDLVEHLRNVPLVTYTGDGGGGPPGIVPPGGGYGSVPPNQVGGYQYSTGGYPTAPYGPGYAPGYEEWQPGYQTGYPVYQDGMMVDPQGNPVNFADSVYRGQAAYGDPGTLIYSLWGGMFGGGGTIKERADVTGYKTKQIGGFVGLDLFCSCDCRNGIFYAYQKGELKEDDKRYNYAYPQRGNLFDPASILGTGEEAQYETAYDYMTNVAGAYNGKLKANNHLIGMYHLFGSEFVYNVATLRFGYNRVKSTSNLSEMGSTNGTVTETLRNYSDGGLVGESSASHDVSEASSRAYYMTGKYNEYLGGVSFERGANLKFLSVLTFTPRGSLDYTYMFRSKFNEMVEGVGVNTYKKKSYHSLRSQLGADLAMDLYPGDAHLRLLARGGWIHEFLNDHYGKTTMTDLRGAPWTIQGNPTGRDWAVIGAGGEWTIVPSFMIFANYDLYKNKYITSHYGDVGLKFMW
ncbi:MAG: autotransporter outer membrane beta-barrel domain-containing protein [Thermoguttaceae bacterium]|jgi:uncharacterized protein YhjY with autotransporter beta-barrel domain